MAIVEKLEIEKKQLLIALEKANKELNHHSKMKTDQYLLVKSIEKEIQDLENLIIYAKKL
jgi:hypothetical protein